MSIQEKETIVSLISTFVIVTGYLFYIDSDYGSVTDQMSMLTFWATYILLLMPIFILIKIVIIIIFAIINKIITDEELPEHSDELDQLIDLRAARNTLIVMTLSLLGAVSLIPIGYGLEAMLIGIIVCITISMAAWDITRIYFYRRGF